MKKSEGSAFDILMNIRAISGLLFIQWPSSEYCMLLEKYVVSFVSSMSDDFEWVVFFSNFLTNTRQLQWTVPMPSVWSFDKNLVDGESNYVGRYVKRCLLAERRHFYSLKNILQAKYS